TSSPRSSIRSCAPVRCGRPRSTSGSFARPRADPATFKLTRPLNSSVSFGYEELLSRAKKALPAALSSGERFQVPSPDVLIEGKVYELMVQDIGKKGDGIAKLDKYVIYVPGTAKGAIVKVFIEKIAGTVAFGRVTRE